MTSLVDRRPTECKKCEQQQMENRLKMDLSLLEPHVEPDVLDAAVKLLYKAQTAGIAELYLKEFDANAVLSRIVNCPVMQAIFTKEGEFTYGQKMVLCSVSLSSDRAKLIEDMVAVGLKCQMNDCRPTDSLHQQEVTRRVERVLKGEDNGPCSSISPPDGRIKAFCKGIANAFRALTMRCKHAG